MLRFRQTFSVMLLVSALAVSVAAKAQPPSGAPTTPPPAAAAPAPANAAAPAAPAAEARQRFLIYFNEFSAYLSPRAKAIIADAARKAKPTAPLIAVQARASATGTVQTNKYLAMTRASIVADELEADGIEPAMVEQQPIGQTGSSDPSCSTAASTSSCILSAGASDAAASTGA